MDTFARATATTRPSSTNAHFADCNADLSDTLRQHMFIVDVIPRSFLPIQRNNNGGGAGAPSEDSDLGALPALPAAPLPEQHHESDDRRVRKTLDDLEDDIRELEDFLTVTEDVLRRERQRDREFYARERRRQRRMAEQQHMQIICNGSRAVNRNNNDEQEDEAVAAATMTSASGGPTRSIPTRPIYSLKSPTYKRPMHAALRKCKSAVPVPGYHLPPLQERSQHQLRFMRQSWPNDAVVESVKESPSSTKTHSRRPSTTAGVLKRMLRKRDEFDLLGSVLLDGIDDEVAESEFDPECLKRRRSDLVDGLDKTSTDKLMELSDDDEKDDGSLEMIVVLGAADSIEAASAVRVENAVEQEVQPMRTESAYSDASCVILCSC